MNEMILVLAMTLMTIGGCVIGAALANFSWWLEKRKERSNKQK